MRTNGPWKIKGTKLIKKNKYVEYYIDRIISPVGKESEYNKISLPDGVLILPIDGQQNVYLAEQFRYISGRKCLEAAGGHIDRGESPLATAKRELKEELGATAKRWISLGGTRPFAGIIRNTAYGFIATDLVFGKSKNDPTENIKIKKVSLKKAIQMVMSGQINHTPSCLLILKAEKYLKNKVNV